MVEVGGAVWRPARLDKAHTREPVIESQQPQPAMLEQVMLRGIVGAKRRDCGGVACCEALGIPAAYATKVTEDRRRVGLEGGILTVQAKGCRRGTIQSC